MQLWIDEGTHVLCMYVCVYVRIMHVRLCVRTYARMDGCSRVCVLHGSIVVDGCMYGVATIGRLLEIMGLFCRISSLL